MSVEELIAKLQGYPPHYEVRAVVVQFEKDDETTDIVDVTNEVENKFVNIELDGRPS